MIQINNFFNELRNNHGAIWIDDTAIKLSTPKSLQNQKNRNFILNNEQQIKSVLNQNLIFSRQHFFNKVILVNNLVSSYPLSPAQERLWFIEQYEEGTNAYHKPEIYELDAAADQQGIRSALQQIVSRHEVLRSTIEQDATLNQGIQVVHHEPLATEDINLEAGDDYHTLLKKEINRPFDLSKEYPIRARFYHIPAAGGSEKKAILLINMHHIASDGWSEDLFQKELSTCYEAYIKGDREFKLPTLEIQYKDYALWQRSYLSGDVLEKQLSYWKEKLSGYQPLEFPTDYARPGEIDYRGAHQEFTLNKALSGKLKALAQKHGLTLNTVMLSAMSILLGKYTGQDDIVIGSLIANRHHRQTEELIGFFVNTQANRIFLSPDQSFEELLLRVHREQIEAQEHQDLPFEKLVNELGVERDPSRHPVFQIMFEVRNFDTQKSSQDILKKHLKAYPLNSYEIEQFDLSITIEHTEEELAGEISYATSLFRKESMARFARHYTHLLEQLSEEPEKAYADFSLLDAEEYRQLQDWNATEKTYSQDKTIHRLFEEQVLRTPRHIALMYEDQELSYQELNEKSNQLARQIRKQYQQRTHQELAPDTLIALCLERGPEMVIGILAVLKAGGAYVPIDPDYPQERIDWMLEDTDTVMILSLKSQEEKVRQKLPAEKIMYIDLDEKCYQNEGETDLLPVSKPESLAYIIYTSGTTGKPKGALIEHAGMINHMEAMIDQLGLDENSRLAQNAPQSFDISVWQMLTCLVTGGRTVIYSDELILSTQAFIEQVTSDGITVLEVVPSYLTVLLDEIELHHTAGAFKHLNYLITTGETVKQELVARWFRLFPSILMVNAYGPAEASDDISLHMMDKAPEKLIVPIGKSIQNLKIYVVDKHGQLCPVGVKGEIWVSGIGVGRGYLNNKEKTQQAFSTDPFIKDKTVRLYKTGDVGKYLPDGSLEYSGRDDDQVKIRGFRIELGEIEHAMLQVPGVKQACVLAKAAQIETHTNHYLAGYYILSNQEENITDSLIREKLFQVLPDYMVPSVFVKMDEFPLTINGKLNKKAFPKPVLHNPLPAYVAPVGDMEITVCKIWQALLGLERVGTRDDFFKIGGNSILAIQVSHRMSKALACHVKVADIFKYKTISRILAQLLLKEQIQIPASDARQSVLSYSQERLWFIEQYEQGTNAYHIPEIYELNAGTNQQGLIYALQQIVSRHEVLRSTIEQDPALNQGIQVVHDEPLAITEISVQPSEDYKALLKADVNRPFGLSREYPIRVSFYHILATDESKQKTLLLINMHHIASDGWSEALFQKELLAYYEAYVQGHKEFKLPALEIQYKDYALWQRSYLTGRVLEEQLHYWKEKLSGYQSLEFPTDYSRPNQIDYRGAHHDFIWSRDLSAKLRTLAQKHGVTLNTVMLSGITILLSKYTGQEDVVIGSAMANRHHRQTEDLIGFFVNTQVNRTILSLDQSFEELLLQVHQQQIEAQLHQDLPFEKLVTELGVEPDPSRHPVFQILFTLDSFDGDSKQAVYLKPYQEEVYEVEKFDISVYIGDSTDELSGQISYATSLFREESMVRFAGHYRYLMEQLSDAPEKAYASFGLLNAEEYQQIMHDWNATEKAYSQHKTIYRLFEEQVERTPQHRALVFENRTLSYGELNKKSNQLARHIRKEYQLKTTKELMPDTLIALCIDRSLEMVIGILAILKAGGAYVPIDPGYPKERIDWMLEDTDTTLVLSLRSQEEKLSDKLPAEKVMYIDLDEQCYQKEDNTNLPLINKPEDLAYVIYTSGTTGKPKGAMLRHDGIVNRIEWMQSSYPLSAEDVVLQKTPYVFDVSVWELLWANWYGATIVFAKPEGHKDSDYLHQLIQNNKVTTLHFVPSMLDAYTHFLLDQKKKLGGSVRQVFCSGEALAKNTVSQSYQHATHPSFKLHNLYGPTEASVDVSYYETSADKPVYIGKPIQNTYLYILNSQLQPVPIGVAGELYIGGAGLSRGYLNRFELTAERFIPNPFATETDKAKGYTRLYKTGDLVKWLPDGNIDYLGRNDDQVKIRGFRIELGEIEQALLQVPGIQQACVLTRERKTNDGNSKYLVGYYTLDNEHEKISESFILETISKSLPDYMLPGALVAMASFPLTINGKLDKRALPDPSFASPTDAYVAPSNELETALCNIWQAVLGLDKVSTADNFFRIGGDSILSIQVASRLRQAGFACQVKDIFEYKTIARLAEYLCKTRITTTLKTEQGTLGGELDFLPIQQWFTEQVDKRKLVNPNHFNQSFLIRVPELDIARLKCAVVELVAYHDALRIRYSKQEKSNGKIVWTQVYQADIDIPELTSLNVDRYSKNEVEQVLTEWQSDFNLEQGPLFRIGYLHGYDDGSARLYVALHHLIVDTVSWRIIAEDLKTLYEGKTLPPKGSSYRQWVEQLKNYPTQHPSEATYWEEQLRGMPEYHSANHSATNTVIVELDNTFTRCLLQDAPKAYHTEVNDLLLTALAYMLKEINYQDVQGITLEGHGREEIDPSIDHSRTVGWFTTMFPVKLELRSTIKESIRFIKEALRTIPNKGLGFGAFATAKDILYSFNELPPVIFNYLGQFDSRQESWQITSEESGKNVSAGNKDQNLIHIVGMVSDGKLEFSIVTKSGKVATETLAASFKQHLTQVVEHCLQKLNEEGSSNTPSDFKAVQISQNLLDKLKLNAKNM